MTHLAANLNLRDREAVPDALYRSIIGLDTRDQKMFESAWHPDARFRFDDTDLQGRDAILGNTFQFVGKMLDTTHMVSNVRVEVKDGADTAKLTAHSLAQHYRGGEGRNPKATRFLTGSLYYLDLVKDNSDGLWKIKDFLMVIQWNEGDASIFDIAGEQ